MCCSILQVETYMLVHKLCIALGVRIVLTFCFLKIPLHMQMWCLLCKAFAVQQQTQTLKLHSFTGDIWSMIWIVFWCDSSEIRAQLYCWEESLDLSFFYDDIKDALDKPWGDQRLDLRCLYLRWRSRKSVALCRSAQPLLLIGVVTDCKCASMSVSDWGNVWQMLIMQEWMF